MARTDIETFERRTFAAWPALETQERSGWLLRFAGGYTRRSNSVNPIAFTAEAADLEALLAECEAAYAAQGLPVVFKLTPGSQPPDLDAFLAERAYALQSGALVMSCDLTSREFALDTRAQVSAELHDAWLSEFARMNAVNPQSVGVMRQLLTRIEPERAFLHLEVDGQIVAVGLGVADEGYLGIFDVVVDPDYRRQGLGRALVKSLLAWGKNKGAHTAYLQVVRENLAARALYEALGFELQYEYVYRVKPLFTD